jgi:hypothetical protein
MGISIAYRGKLRSPDLVPELVADVRARAEAAGWRHKEMAELLADGTVKRAGLTGITVYPHRECEPLRFHFDAEGVFTNHHYHDMLAPDSEMARMMREAFAESAALTRTLTSSKSAGGKKGKKKGKKGAPAGAPRIEVAALPADAGSPSFMEQGMRYNWTKTQFAGPDVHIAVCDLLRHVKERYAPDLHVKDDSGYFVDGDREKLLGQLAYVDRMVSLTASAFQSAAASKTAPRSLGALLDRVNDELAGAKDKLH